MSLADEVAERHPDAILERGMQKDKPLLVVSPEAIPRVMATARDLGFDHLACLTAVDFPTDELKKAEWLPASVRGVPADEPAASEEAADETEDAPEEGEAQETPEETAPEPAGEPEGVMEVVYNLYAMAAKEHLAVQVFVPRALEACRVPSVAGIWAGADWHEREVYDLYGVTFTGHPNLTRIFMPEDWDGHPGRRDYDISVEQFIYREGTEDRVTKDPGKGW